MWFNIDTRGHKKAPKSQNIAVGPGQLARSKTPVDKGLSLLVLVNSELCYGEIVL